MVNRDAVRCEQVWQEISNYIEDDIDAAVRAAMDEHFRTCQRCASVLAGARNVISLYGDERMIDVPSGFSRRLERRLAQSARVRRANWSTWSAWLVPVAALALFAGGLRFANSLTVPRPERSEMAQKARNIPPDLLVLVSAGAKDFHVPGCGVIHNKDQVRTLTAQEAIDQGYVPCVRCLRKYLEAADLHPGSLELVASAYLDAEQDADDEHSPVGH